MPEYLYACRNSHYFSKYLTLVNHSPIWVCDECGEVAQQVITAPLMVSCEREVRYDSPIDGRPITSREAWREDLKRNGCVEYDPGMKDDQMRRLAESEKALDCHMGETIEREIARMPSEKRAKLAGELESGSTAEVTRN